MDSEPANGHAVPLRRISLSYKTSESEDSALRLAYAIEPKWREEEGDIEITKFTDGITNNVSQGKVLDMIRRALRQSPASEDRQEETWPVPGSNRRWCCFDASLWKQYRDPHRPEPRGQISRAARRTRARTTSPCAIRKWPSIQIHPRASLHTTRSHKRACLEWCCAKARRMAWRAAHRFSVREQTSYERYERRCLQRSHIS